MKFNATIMNLTYTPVVAAIQNASFLSPLIDNEVQRSRIVSIAVHASLMGLSVLIIIPLFLLLRKRQSLH
jgi:hypothetical protein